MKARIALTTALFVTALGASASAEPNEMKKVVISIKVPKPVVTEVANPQKPALDGKVRAPLATAIEAKLDAAPF